MNPVNEAESSSAVNPKLMFKSQESINRQLKEAMAFPDYEQVKVQFSILSESLSIPTINRWLTQKILSAVYNHLFIMLKHSGIEVEAILGYTYEQNQKSQVMIDEYFIILWEKPPYVRHVRARTIYSSKNVKRIILHFTRPNIYF
jgi:hypothetical protein